MVIGIVAGIFALLSVAVGIAEEAPIPDQEGVPAPPEEDLDQIPDVLRMFSCRIKGMRG